MPPSPQRTAPWRRRMPTVLRVVSIAVLAAYAAYLLVAVISLNSSPLDSLSGWWWSSQSERSSSPAPSRTYVASEHAIESIVSDYSRRYGGRSPPTGFAEWARFASDRQCSVNASTYDRIERDLDVFRSRRADRVREGSSRPDDPVITPTMIAYLGGEFRGGDFGEGGGGEVVGL